MWPVSDEFLEALTTSMRMVTLVNLYRQGELVAEDIAVSAGEVTVDANSDVRRTLSMEVPDRELLDLLDPYGCDVRVWRGMVFGDGIIEYCPVGVFRVWSLDYTQPGLAITVEAQDWASLVASDEFINPEKSAPGALCSEEIDRLLTQAGFTGMDDQIGLTDTVGYRAIWDGTRWEAINVLADALDGTVYFDAIGGPTLAPDAPGDTVWTVRAGEGGVLVGTNVAVTREGTYNCVVAEGEEPKTGDPIQAVAKDLDFESPTYWLDDPTEGGFGHAVRKESDAVWNTPDKAARAADRLLRQSIGKIRTVDCSAVPNPALEAGDAILIEYVNGMEEELVIDSFTLPLVGGEFTMTARAKRTLTV